VNIVDSKKSSCAELLYEFFVELKITITVPMARLLFVGMHFDTGGFLYNLVSARTLEVAGALLAIAPEAKSDVLSILGSVPREWVILKGLALGDLVESKDGRVAVGRVSHLAYTQAGISPEKLSTHAVTDVLRGCKQWTVAVGLIEVAPGTIKISLRSKDAQYANVSAIATTLGGGGHVLAAGATVSGKTLDEVTQSVLALITK
jgi:phosphoesterase RecJ-like protein